MSHFLLLVSVALVILIFIAFGRVLAGPGVLDRVLAFNQIGTTTVIVIAVIAQVFGETFFFDVALVYALISFLVTIGMGRYLEREDL
jgi:multicomponent Na+:H+ antiporter subunit F